MPSFVPTSMAGSDREIVADAKAGSAQALGEVFDRFWPTVWRAAYSITRNRAVADDVAQEAFVRAARSLSTFDGSRPFAPWVTRIAVNYAIDLVRRQRREVGLEWRDEQPSAPVEIDDELHAAVLELPLERRAPLVLHFFLGFSVDETAAILEIPPGTASSRISRALSTLRSTLEDVRHV
jgi:RNA polymerase sigma-70 factor, ECF subfamily